MASDLYMGVLLPSDLDRASVARFEELMNEYTELRQQTVPPDLTAQETEKLSTKISKLLVQGNTN